MSDTTGSGRRPIFLIDPAGKSAEQLADETWRALQEYWRATGQIESEPESQNDE